MKTGEQYLESLKDGRRVWFEGELVEDLATHPVLGRSAQLIAEGVDEQLSEVALEPPRRAVHRLLFAARGRGDLRGDVDLRLATDSLISLVFYRLLLGEDPMTAEEIETVVIAVLRGLAADPAELLREYTAHTAHTEHQP